uniref:Homing endonuclease LAGLIDADG domain-containing protein n=1 Tax=Candida saraburiensis TaxID=694444 RepID=S5TF12_9ASCO|nr:hypothetical protein [Candida saraburiensis]AGS44057.1 hypothetical protein [Candida saraburiensis]
MKKVYCKIKRPSYARAHVSIPVSTPPCVPTPHYTILQLKSIFNYDLPDILNMNMKELDIFLKTRGKYNNVYYKPWIVGLTDSIGKFKSYYNFNKSELITTLTLKVPKYQESLIYKVENHIKGGNMSYIKSNKIYILQYKFSDPIILTNKIIPLFDEYPLLIESNRYQYDKLKSYLNIYNSDLSDENKLMEYKLINNGIFNRTISPWNNININNIKSFNEINEIVSKDWITGYLEIEGNFTWNSKSKDKLIHNFHVYSESYDVITAIKLLFDINAKIRNRNKKYYIETTATKSIVNMLEYFVSEKDTYYWVGKKYWEFTLWEKTYMLYKKDYRSNYEVMIRIREKINSERKRSNRTIE